MSPSHHVRQNVGASDPVMTPPASIDTIPTVALIAVATARAANKPPTCSARSMAARGPMSRRSSRAPTTTSAMLPGLLAEQAAERQRVSARRAARR